ncbi:MAG: oligosaccharide flippase family protein [Gammaproteobacteria bacterium]|nr:oligosaccharide flippase family protein [Gammaproteobacteria bacterium]
MNPLRRLASQTAIYGLSSILGRFLNYLLVPLFTYYFSPAEYGVVSEFYAYAGFFAVLLVFGLETGYFRFRGKSPDTTDDTVYATAQRMLFGANIGFFLGIAIFSGSIADALNHGDHSDYVVWIGAILALDSTAAVCFARLRAEEKAWRFAGIKLTEIVITVAMNLFFIVLCRGAYDQDPASMLGRLWNPEIGVGYVFIANLVGSGMKWLLLLPQLRGAGARFDRDLFARMMRYSLPMMVIGFAGVTNEMLDRALMKYLLPYDADTNLAQLGIYSACYKLSILMSLFIQAFRYAGEPFFFAHEGKQGSKALYARVMTAFVIFCMLIFLLVTLYIDVFKYFIGEPFRAGLTVVPVLLLANLFLGIYINLSIWYKLTDRTLTGAWVAMGGAALTIVLNLWWVPILGFMGAAWATLACYIGMAAVSYLLGRRHYPIPYEVPRIFGYIGLGLFLYFSHGWLISAGLLSWPVSATLFLALYLLVACAADGRRLLFPSPQALDDK